MRKTCLSIFIVLLATLSASASPLTPEQARKVALRYLNCSSVAFSADSFTLLGTKASALDSPAFYIFNNPDGGWVIVSGEDSTIPILAAGEGSKFETEDMPEHIRYYLERMTHTINAIRREGLSAASVRSSAAIQTAYSEVHLETPNWGQEEPFNNLCPIYKDGKRSLTGCVATAMAEVLGYNRFPGQGTGVSPEYTTISYSIPMPSINLDLEPEYNWDLPMDVNQTWTQQQKDEVARIMLHIGCIMKMDYGESSGSHNRGIPNALSTYMRYSKTTCYRYREAGSAQEWLNKLKAELDQGRPIIYGGMDMINGGGHSFVCDGYNSNNMIHINWGWNGKANGWFAVNYIGPESETGGVYSEDDMAIISLIPDPDAEDELGNPLLAISTPARPINTKGFTISSGSIQRGSFKITLDALWNLSGYKYVGKVKICLAGNDGKIKFNLSPEKIVSLVDRDLEEEMEFNCSIPSGAKPVPGDIIALYFCDEKGNWIRANKYYSNPYLSTLDKLNPIDFSIIKIPENIRSGNMVYPEVLHRNIRLDSETWALDGKTIDICNFTATAGEHTLEVKLEYTDNSSETVKKKFTVQ